MITPLSDRSDGDAFESDPPVLSAEQALRIAFDVFGLRGDATELGSERDQNFLIDDGRGARGVLKISNAAEEAAILDMETEAALLVARVDPELPVAAPWVVPGSAPASGPSAHRASVASPAGDGSHHVRMFEHMPGRGSVDPTELDRDALWDLGVVVAPPGTCSPRLLPSGGGSRPALGRAARAGAPVAGPVDRGPAASGARRAGARPLRRARAAPVGGAARPGDPRRPHARQRAR